MSEDKSVDKSPLIAKGKRSGEEEQSWESVVEESRSEGGSVHQLDQSSSSYMTASTLDANGDGDGYGRQQQQQALAHPLSSALNPVEIHDNETFDGSEDTPVNPGPRVQCRVCEAEIALEGKNGQHVIRCQHCNEVTPIRAAPPGKKYVRCPCNCLLVCKVTSTRIACPRQNCRRVITLANGPPNTSMTGTAIRAPVGTCRVQCAYCKEVFMFNTLTNQLANCPHCRGSSSVGARYARSRSVLYFTGLLLATTFLIGLIVAISQDPSNSFFMWAFMVLMLITCLFLTYRFVFFLRIKISQVLGPLC